MRGLFGMASLSLLLVPLAALGQESPGTVGGEAVDLGSSSPILQAVRASTEPRIDGLIDEAIWSSAPVATGFVQMNPDEGQPATERTEVRVLYGADALFVAFHAYDSEPSEIVAQLTRRDQGSYSDWLMVQIDSYFDRRTAFQFEVNPLGVKQDIYRFNDTNQDNGWDAVWDVATQRTEDGWTAEFRIPYSQLRFGNGDNQTWGINFGRRIARRQELSTWAPLSNNSNKVVSVSGELRGLRGLGSPRRLEVLPYSVARLTREPGSTENPFYDQNAVFSSVGADLKYGITNDLTLDVSINPDFGQVEADPGQVNLTAFETFFQERRPFFQEGVGIFQFGLGGGDGGFESLFYSRRIGRAPHGFANPRGGYAEQDEQTTILGAWKLSGKTQGGWSIGLLNAVTGEESADIVTGDGEEMSEVVEPFTNYSVGRVIKDFRDGKSAVGLIATAANRSRDAADAIGIRTGGYSGGLDARHRFADDQWEVSGYLLGSHVRGSTEAIERTQLAPGRYFQRPDADHLDLDDQRTSLTGWAAQANLSKFAGGFWRASTGVQARSPGFEVNDLGFMNETDWISPFVWGGYHHTTPQGPFLRYFINANGWGGWTFGGEKVAVGGNVNGSFQLRNFWGGYAGIMREFENFSTGLLRGGPLFIEEPAWRGWWGMNSDTRRSVSLFVNNNWSNRPESGSWSYNVSPSIQWRPSGRASLSLGPSFNWTVEDRQWVQRIESGAGTEFLLGRLDQNTVGLTTRLNYSFTPDLSLQVYAQPFISAGSYDEFKRVTDPRGEAYEDRFERLAPTLQESVEDDGSRSIWYEADLDRDGARESFRFPDFNFKQFRSNVVLRWEYRPGSALFVVWSQGRNHRGEDGTYEFGGDLGRLFDTQPSNVFLIKLSYWLNP